MTTMFHSVDIQVNVTSSSQLRVTGFQWMSSQWFWVKEYGINMWIFIQLFTLISACNILSMTKTKTNSSNMIDDGQLLINVSGYNHLMEFQVEGPISIWDGLIRISLRDATKWNFSLVSKLIEAWNVYSMVLMYITLSTNEHKFVRLICLFTFTVDSGGSTNRHYWYYLTNSI